MTGQRAIQVLKYLVVVAALSYLILTGKLSPHGLTFYRERWGMAALAVGCLLLACLLSYIRWFYLLRGVEISIPLFTAIRFGFIGLFFNAFLFGGFGGDVVKIAYIVRETSRRAAAVASVLVDRVLGMLGLLALGGFAIILSWQEVLKTEGLPLLALVLFAILAGVALSLFTAFVAIVLGRVHALGFVAVLFGLDALVLSHSVAGESFGLMSLYAHLATNADLALAAATALFLPGLMPGRGLASFARSRLPGGRAVMSLIEGLLAYRHRAGILAFSLFLSLVLQGLVLVAVVFLAQATGFNVTASQVFFAAPPAFVINVVPVPMGGLGVGETAFGELLKTCTGGLVTNGALLFLGWRIVMNLIGVVFGLPVYLVGRKEIREIETKYAQESLKGGGEA
ncbi:MAG: lysylphosphatidylglycerol synthase transmembrane domain-containing protein [Planctomycetota bacterium]